MTWPKIQAFISRESPESALRVVAGLIDRSRQLSENPFEGRKTDEPHVHVIVERRLRYLTIYKIESDEIHIIHIRHISRCRPGDWGR